MSRKHQFQSFFSFYTDREKNSWNVNIYFYCFLTKESISNNVPNNANVCVWEKEFMPTWLDLTHSTNQKWKFEIDNDKKTDFLDSILIFFIQEQPKNFFSYKFMTSLLKFLNFVCVFFVHTFSSSSFYHDDHVDDY